jgi:hypothetical protein
VEHATWLAGYKAVQISVTAARKTITATIQPVPRIAHDDPNGASDQAAQLQSP